MFVETKNLDFMGYCFVVAMCLLPLISTVNSDVYAWCLLKGTATKECSSIGWLEICFSYIDTTDMCTVQ